MIDAATQTDVFSMAGSGENCLRIIAHPVYGYSAPAKSGARIGVLNLHTATQTRPASFLLSQLSHTQIMVGCVGASSEAPVSVCAGYLAYMDAHGFDKYLTLTRFGSDLPKVMKEYGAEYKKAKTNAGMRYNMELAMSADDWLPASPRQPEDMR